MPNYRPCKTEKCLEAIVASFKLKASPRVGWSDPSPAWPECSVAVGVDGDGDEIGSVSAPSGPPTRWSTRRPGWRWSPLSRATRRPPWGT